MKSNNSILILAFIFVIIDSVSSQDIYIQNLIDDYTSKVNNKLFFIHEKFEDTLYVDSFNYSRFETDIDNRCTSNKSLLLFKQGKISRILRARSNGIVIDCFDIIDTVGKYIIFHAFTQGKDGFPYNTSGFFFNDTVLKQTYYIGLLEKRFCNPRITIECLEDDQNLICDTTAVSFSVKPCTSEDVVCVILLDEMLKPTEETTWWQNTFVNYCRFDVNNNQLFGNLYFYGGPCIHKYLLNNIPLSDWPYLFSGIQCELVIRLFGVLIEKDINSPIWSDNLRYYRCMKTL